MIRLHIHIYILQYYNTEIQLYYSSVLACVVGTQVEIQYTTAVRVHATYYIVHTLQQQTATAAAVAVLPLLALSAAACFTLYTAVYIVVCCHCWT